MDKRTGKKKKQKNEKPSLPEVLIPEQKAPIIPPKKRVIPSGH